MKCPNSYCIQMWLVCDGQEHCPNGEDELYCGKVLGLYRTVGVKMIFSGIGIYFIVLKS